MFKLPIFTYTENVSFYSQFVDSGDNDKSYQRLSVEDVQEILEKMRAKDVEVLNVKRKCGWTDWMVIATGTSARHLLGMAEAITFEVSFSVGNCR